MGLFDKILKEVGSTIEKAVKDGLKSETTTSTNESRPVVNNNESISGEVHDKSYFKEILNSEFNQYEIKDNVQVSELGGEGRPYDFGLYQLGSIKGVIVLVEHNKTRNKPYWNSEKKAQEAKVPFINFYLHMPNERDFVIYRINKLLSK